MLRIVSSYLDSAPASPSDARTQEPIEFGFVYLLRSGRNYKLGRTNSFGRRERELALQLPERAQTVHVFKTDDPVGIERYWHMRFADRRKNGEWFELTSDDVTAFNRREFMQSFTRSSFAACETGSAAPTLRWSRRHHTGRAA